MDELPPIELGGFPIGVYGAMFGGTVAGQFVGFGIDAVAGHHAFWVPVACSVLLEAVAGFLFASRVRGHRGTTTAEWGRLSGIYSMGLAAVTVPMAVWSAAARTPPAPFGGHDPSGMVVLALGVLAVLTGVRWAILVGLASRRAGPHAHGTGAGGGAS